MNIELKDLLSLMTDAVDAGVQKYVRSCDPQADYIKQAEAKRSSRPRQSATCRSWASRRRCCNGGSMADCSPP